MPHRATRGLQTVGEGVLEGGPTGLTAPGREWDSERLVYLGHSDQAGRGGRKGVRGQRQAGPQWRGPRRLSLGRWLSWEEDGGLWAEESDHLIQCQNGHFPGLVEDTRGEQDWPAGCRRGQDVTEAGAGAVVWRWREMVGPG